MEVKLFCRGSRKLAIKYRYYMKYNIMLAVCLVTPIIIFLFDHFGIIKVGKLRASTMIIALLLLIWLIILVLGFIGFGAVNGLQYQIFAITTEDKIIHFWFKEMLKDGKVVLQFSPYHKRATKREYVDVVKKKEEIIKDENLEEYLCALVNDPQVQKQSDILFEVMDDIVVLRKKRNYIDVQYTIGQLGTKKKLRIYKNITNWEEIEKRIKTNTNKR